MEPMWAHTILIPENGASRNPLDVETLPQPKLKKVIGYLFASLGLSTKEN